MNNYELLEQWESFHVLNYWVMSEEGCYNNDQRLYKKDLIWKNS